MPTAHCDGPSLYAYTIEAGPRALAASGPEAVRTEPLARTPGVSGGVLLSFSIVIGNHSIAAGHGARSRTEIIELALKQLGA